MYQTRVISDESQVPNGFVRLKELAEKYSDTDRKKLSDAHNNGKIRAVKIMRTVNDRTGATYLHAEDAERFLKGRAKRTEENLAGASWPMGMSEHQYVAYLSRESALIELARRIADAQEKAVTILARMESLWESK
jgi:hypothetical protein